MFNDNLRVGGTLFTPLTVHAGDHPLLYILCFLDSSHNQSSPPPARPKDSSLLSSLTTPYSGSPPPNKDTLSKTSPIFTNYLAYKWRIQQNTSINKTATSDPVLQANSAYDSFRAIPLSSRVLNLYPPQPALS